MTYEEVWKPISNHNGYSVSNMGKIKNDQTGKILKGWISKCSETYKRHLVGLKTSEGKYKAYRVHRLVATEFVPNKNNYPVVNHLDENPLNNRADNLEWTTYRGNIEYSLKRHPSHKIDVSLFEKIKDEYRSGKTMKQISRELNVPYCPVKKIIADANIKIRKAGCQKYNIDLSELLLEFQNGRSYADLMKKYKCSYDILATRKHQFRKDGLLK